MAEIITVKVTQECIYKGRPGTPNDCPIFHAGIVAGLDMVGVEDGQLIFNQDTFGCFYTLPGNIYTIINDYDDGAGMEPFEFSFDMAEIQEA